MRQLQYRHSRATTLLSPELTKAKRGWMPGKRRGNAGAVDDPDISIRGKRDGGLREGRRGDVDALPSGTLDHHAEKRGNVWRGHFLARSIALALHGHEAAVRVIAHDVYAEVASTTDVLRCPVADQREESSDRVLELGRTELEKVIENCPVASWFYRGNRGPCFHTLALALPRLWRRRRCQLRRLILRLAPH